jgi:signal transduction histidine kinase
MSPTAVRCRFAAEVSWLAKHLADTAVVSADPASRTAPLGKVRYRDIRPASQSLAALAAAVAVLATLIVTFVPGLDSVESSKAASSAIDTAATIALGITAAIVAGRARHGASRMDLLLADGLLVLALATFFLALVPDLSSSSGRTFAVWAGTATRLLAVALFLAATTRRPKPLEAPGKEMRRGLLGAVASAGIVIVIVALLGDALPSLPELPHASHISRDILAGPASLTITEVILGVGLLIASFGFAKQSERMQDALLAWVAAGLALAAFSRVGYALFPSQGGDYLYIGDVLGLAAFLILLTGASIEVLGAQEALTEAAVRDERRRIARDLHDGLAQELAFITAQTRRMFSREPAGRAGDELLAAAERALEESRLAISGLIRPSDKPLHQTLRDAATSTAARAGVEVVFDLEPGIAVSPEARQALLRVQAQAIVNAVVHGNAKRVCISLRSQPQTRLSVVDDGDGFDPDAPTRPDSIGLASIRERAEALGGELLVRSAPGTGSAIEVVLP